MSKEKSEKVLRKGYTTGANATAATKAALIALITQSKIDEVEIELPIGEVVRFTVNNLRFSTTEAEAGMIKDAGDDPDVTHGAEIRAQVSWLKDNEIIITGGVGVGKVTKPGLPVAVGNSAINPVPYRMIQRIAEESLQEYGIAHGVKVVISVPNGEELAKQTLNPRLGIVGGISILGSRGTVIPYSIADYKASIVQAIRVARINGDQHFVFTTGSSSEKYAQDIYSALPESAFIQMGEFVGFSLQHAKRQKATKVSMVSMIGKLSKIAQGKMMVHSKVTKIDFDFLAEIAARIGASDNLQAQIKSANTAAHVAELIQEAGLQEFFTEICNLACQEALRHIQKGLTIEAILLEKDGSILGRTELNG